MNEKQARFARNVNRMIGKLKKASDIPLDDIGRRMIGDGNQHKLPAHVKVGWDRLSHRARGKFSKHWRAAFARHLRDVGVVPKGNATLPKPRRDRPRRSVRKIIDRAFGVRS